MGSKNEVSKYASSYAVPDFRIGCSFSVVVVVIFVLSFFVLSTNSRAYFIDGTHWNDFEEVYINPMHVCYVHAHQNCIVIQCLCFVFFFLSSHFHVNSRLCVSYCIKKRRRQMQNFNICQLAIAWSILVFIFTHFCVCFF